MGIDLAWLCYAYIHSNIFKLKEKKYEKDSKSKDVQAKVVILFSNYNLERLKFLEWNNFFFF